LTYLTKKGVFIWLDDAQVTFNKMKRVMSTCPILALPYFMHHFPLECDTSGEGIGVVLMQNQQPITLENKNLRETNNL